MRVRSPCSRTRAARRVASVRGRRARRPPSEPAPPGRSLSGSRAGLPDGSFTTPLCTTAGPRRVRRRTTRASLRGFAGSLKRGVPVPVELRVASRTPAEVPARVQLERRREARHRRHRVHVHDRVPALAFDVEVDVHARRDPGRDDRARARRSGHAVARALDRRHGRGERAVRRGRRSRADRAPRSARDRLLDADVRGPGPGAPRQRQTLARQDAVGSGGERGGYDVEVAAHERVQRAHERVAAWLVDLLRPRREARQRTGAERADQHVVRHEVVVAEQHDVARHHRRARRIEELARHGDRGRLRVRAGGSGEQQRDGSGGAAHHGRTL